MTDLLDFLGDEPSPTDFPDGAPPAGQSAGLDLMLGGSDDDDVYGSPAPAAAAPQPAAASSPLIEWQRQKDAEIADKDAQDDALSRQLAANAQTARDGHFETIRTAQEKRAKLNEESDRQFVTALEAEGSPWQKVAKFVNLQAAQNPGTDLSRFKTLLIQLKQQ
jgi:hypothetical protein